MVERTAVEYVSSVGRPKLYETCTYLCQIFLKLELFQYRYKIGIHVKSAFKKCCVSLVIYSKNTENKPMTSRWNYFLSRHFFVLDSAQPTNVIGRYKNFFSCTAWFEYLFQFNTPSFPYSGRERERERETQKMNCLRELYFCDRINLSLPLRWPPFFSQAQSSFSDTSMLWNAHSIGLQFFLECVFLWIAELKFFATRIAWEIMTN